jgi:hypothetical protein
MLRADLDDFDDDADVADADDGPRERGKYVTWRSLDPLHQAVMRCLAPHVTDAPEARLWLAVIEQALVDEHLGTRRHCDFDPEDRRWRDSGLDSFFLRSQRCHDVCDLAGLDWPWFRRIVDAYAAHRRGAA